MKPLRCDFCNGQLIMDKSREFAVCEFCGTKYMKETIQDKIQEIRGQVSITGSVEMVTGNAEKERILNNAETYIRIKEYDKAIQAYQQIIRQFPEDYRGWWGLYTTPVDCYFVTGVFAEAEPNALRNTYNLCKEKKILTDYFEEIIKKYGSTLRLVPTKDTINYVLNKKTTNALSLDSFTSWLLFTQAKNLPYYTESFKAFIAKLSDLYMSGCKKGTVYAAKDQWNPVLCTNSLYIDASTFYIGTLIDAISTFNSARNSTAPITPGTTSPCFYKVGWGNDYADITQITGIFGRWIYTINKQGEAVTLLSYREITKDMIFRLNGRCQYCGGIFKGVIHPACRLCGKPKDY